MEISKELNMSEIHTAKPVLSIKDLRTYFHTADGIAKAVDGLDYHVYPGETLGVVGESGCGKSVSALSILRLIATRDGGIVRGPQTPHVLEGIDHLQKPHVDAQRASIIAKLFMSSIPIRSLRLRQLDCLFL